MNPLMTDSRLGLDKGGQRLWRPIGQVAQCHLRRYDITAQCKFMCPLDAVKLCMSLSTIVI